MHYTRRTPTGVCSLYGIKLRNTFRIFGIILTEKNKLLFFHQQNDQKKSIIYLVQNKEASLEI